MVNNDDMIKPDENFNQSLKKLIMVEMQKLRPVTDVIEDLEAGKFSRELERFLIVRSGAAEQLLRAEILESSLRAFQLSFAKSIMYLLIAALLAPCFQIGNAYIDYLSFVYGALSFYIITVMLCYFYHRRVTASKSSMAKGYRDALYEILKSLDSPDGRVKREDEGRQKTSADG